MATTLQILRKARKLIEKPERWTTRTAARAKNGRSVLSRSPQAYSFCAIGALSRAGLSLKAAFPAREAARYAVERVTRTNWLPRWNDSPRRTHAQVLRAFDKAIAAAAKAEGKAGKP